MNTLRGKSPGVVFRMEGGQIRSRLTQRADLMADRLRNQRRRAADLDRAQRRGEGKNLTVVIEIVGVIQMSTEPLASKLEATLRHTFGRAGSGNGYSASDVAKVLVYCRKQGLTVYGLQNDPDPASDKLAKPVVEIRTVPDPTIPRETLIEQLIEIETQELKAAEDHITDRRKRGMPARGVTDLPPVQPGYQYAGVNMASLVGGFSRLRERTDIQTEAVAEYRRLADQAQLGGARAIDYENVKVDTSGPTVDSVVDTGFDARQKYHAARKALQGDAIGEQRVAVIDALVIGGQNMAGAAKAAGLGSHGRGRKKATALALDAADRLARQFGYLPSHRASVRFEGDHPAGIPVEFRSQGPRRKTPKGAGA